MSENYKLTKTSVGKQIILHSFNALESGEAVELVEERDIVVKHPDGRVEHIDRRFRLVKRKI